MYRVLIYYIDKDGVKQKSVHNYFEEKKKALQFVKDFKIAYPGFKVYDAVVLER